MRIFVLIDEYGIYLYKEENYVYIYPVLYNRDSLDIYHHNNCMYFRIMKKNVPMKNYQNKYIIKLYYLN